LLTNHPNVLGSGGSSGGAGSVIVKDEGTTVVTATTFDFVGSSVAVTDGGSGVATVTISGGGTSYSEVLTYADLPIVVGTPPVGTVYLVKTSTGAWYTFNKKESGLWRRTADTGALSDWTHLGDAAELTVDTTFAIGDDGDNTKKLMFSTGGGTTATTLTLATAQTANRTVTLPDATDTLVGRDTTDTLTNKSIVATQLTGTIADARMPALTGDATTTVGTVATTVGKINGVSMAGLATGILKNTTTTGVPSIAVAGDFPTLNQSTTGSAATLTTPRAIYGNNFDGSAALTQVIASTYGGTGNGFAKLSGPTTAERTFTLPDASATILTSAAAVTVAQGGSGQTSYTNGQLLIGNTTGNTLDKATLTAGTNVTVTNGGGSITIAANGGSPRISILNSSVVPDTTGEAFFEPYTILATNDVFKHIVLRLGSSNSAAPTIDGGVYGTFLVPQNYVGTAVIYIRWTATITTNDVYFGFSYRAIGGNDSESLDQATFQEAVSVTDTAPGAANRLMEASVSLTSSNIAAGDIVEFYFYRGGSQAGDTMAGSALVHDLDFGYSTIS